jgi:hypothetical protein
METEQYRITDKRKARFYDLLKQPDQIAPTQYGQRNRPPVISWQGITELIGELKTKLAEAKVRYLNAELHDARRAQDVARLTREFEDLQAKLAATKSELDQLKAVPTERDAYVAVLVDAETQTSAIANGEYNRILADLSSDAYDSDFRDLPETLKDGITFQAKRSGLLTYIQGSWQRLFRLKEAGSISEPVIQSTVEKVSRAIEHLESNIPSEDI